MQLGIFAKTFPRQTVEETFDAALKHDLNCVQFNMSCAGLPSLPDRIEPDTITRIQESAKCRGITLAAVSGTYNMIHPNPQLRKDGLRRLRTLASACHGMGTDVITLSTGTRDPKDLWRWHPDNASSQAWSDLLLAMEAALQIAEEEQVTLAFEPEPANVVSTATKGKKLLQTMQSPRLKVVFDAANLFNTESEQHHILDEAFDLLGEYIVIAHAKDRGPDMSFQAAGEGIIDYDRYLSLLQVGGFQGPLILHGLVEAQVDASIQFLRSRL